MKRLTLLPIAVLAITLTFFYASCSKSGSNSNPTPVIPSTSITSLSANSGPYNTSVIITGNGFSSNAANDQVFFNGKAATVTAATTTSLTATVPVGAGTGNVTVSVNGTTAVKGPVFTYQTSLVASILAGTGSAGNTDGLGTAASFNQPAGLTVDKSGNVYVADQKNNVIRKITSNGTVSTFAGSGIKGNVNGTGIAACFNFPTAIVADNSGNLFVADRGNSEIRKITPTGIVTTFAGSGVFGNTDGVGSSASFQSLNNIVIDGNGNLYLTDYSTIRMVTSTAVVSTYQKGTLSFKLPYGLAIDAAGNLYVSDLVAATVTKVTPQGIISKLPALNGSTTIDGAIALTTDAAGNVYMVAYSSNFIIKYSGDITSGYFIGGTNLNGPSGLAITPALNSPEGITFDAAGNFYVSDTNNYLVRKFSMQ